MIFPTNWLHGLPDPEKNMLHFYNRKQRKHIKEVLDKIGYIGFDNVMVLKDETKGWWAELKYVKYLLVED